MTQKVGLFFFANGEFLLHECALSDAEAYGDYLIYPESHMDVWEKHYAQKYHVDFDYFPRGRIVYRKSDGMYRIYYDRCMENDLSALKSRYATAKASFELDEHYQCHHCNPYYVM